MPQFATLTYHERDRLKKSALKLWMELMAANGLPTAASEVLTTTRITIPCAVLYSGIACSTHFCLSDVGSPVI